VACLEEDTLVGFVVGTLDAESRQSVLHHIDDCDACRRLVAATADELVPEEPTTRRERKRVSGWDQTQPVGETASAHVAMLDLLEIDPSVYAIDGEHARGGLGRILRAWDRRLQRSVAIKELLHVSAEAEARFVREALIIARLQHPSIVPIIEAGRWPSGKPFYAMKLISGRSFRQVIADTSTLEQRLALLPNVLAAADAVAYAHSQRIIHRDLKPANILVGAFGETLVIDWGLAKDLAGPEPSAAHPGLCEAAAHDMTVYGTVIGTPAYMPPEQARGLEVDERADVYSLGAVLYEALAARAPYSGPSGTEVLAAVTAAAPPPVEVQEPGTPRELATIIRKAMARDPRDRYPTARELSEDLRRFQTGQLVSAHVYSPIARLSRWVSRNRATVVVAAILAAALAATGTVGIVGIIGERNRAEHQRALAEQRTHQLLLNQARGALERDPTAAVAWLKSYPPKASDWRTAFELLVQASSRPIALHVLTGHREGVTAAAFSTDGMRLVSGSRDRTVRLWDLKSGRQLAMADRGGSLTFTRFSTDGKTVITADHDGRIGVSSERLTDVHYLTGHQGPITSLAASPDGRRLASVGMDGTLRIWDLEGGQARVYDGHKGALSSVAFAEDGRVVAAVGASQTVRRWDVEPGPGRTLGQHDKALSWIRFSPDGNLLASGSVDGGVCLWRAGATGCQRLGTHEGSVQSLAFSSDGRWLASGGRDRTVRIWDVGKGEGRVLRGHRDQVISVDFSPDGQMLVSATADGQVRLWDLASEDSVDLSGHRSTLERALFSADGKWIASLGDDGEIRIWPAHIEGRALHGHRDEIGDLAISPDGRRLASASLDETVRLWDLQGGGSQTLRHRDQVRFVRFAPDGRSLISASVEPSLRRWDLQTGESKILDSAAVFYLQFSPDGRWLATRGLDPNVRLLDWQSGAWHTLTASAGQVNTALFSPDASPDGHRLASGGADGSVRLWDPASGQARVLGSHGSAVSRVAFSPDGRWLASAGADKLVQLWPLDGGHNRGWGPIPIPAHWLAFSTDGQWLAADSGRSIRAWNLRSLESRELVGHTDLIRRLVFCSGTLLTSAGADGTVRLWDLQSGGERIVHRHGSYVNGLAFSKDSGWLASASSDATVWTWPLDTSVLLSPQPADMRVAMSRMTSAVINATDQPSSP
jgi:WD40 repeat protein